MFLPQMPGAKCYLDCDGWIHTGKHICNCHHSVIVIYGPRRLMLGVVWRSWNWHLTFIITYYDTIIAYYDTNSWFLGKQYKGKWVSEIEPLVVLQHYAQCELLPRDQPVSPDSRVLSQFARNSWVRLTTVRCTIQNHRGSSLSLLSAE